MAQRLTPNQNESPAGQDALPEAPLREATFRPPSLSRGPEHDAPSRAASFRPREEVAQRLDALEEALGAGVEVVRTASVDEAADAAAAGRTGAILVKASRAARLERVVDVRCERLATDGAAAAHAVLGGQGA